MMANKLNKCSTQLSKADWLEDTDEEVDEQELEAHYSYMAKIQEVSPEESSSTSQPLEQNEFEKYKAFNDRRIDYEILQTKLNETLGLLALKDIEIKEGLKTKAYEISVVNQKHDELVKKSLLNKGHTGRLTSKRNTKECGKCVFNSNHDACVSRYLKDVNARTKKPNVVPISASKPKRKANKSVATPHKKTVASDTTIQKSKSYYKELYENTNQEWKWWIAKRCPSGYTWTQKPLRTKKIWMPKIRKDNVSLNISPTIDIVSRITNVLKISNCIGSNLSNVSSLLILLAMYNSSYSLLTLDAQST
ncbi:hypothetical protein Tco_0110599 [Tanacetum coccineum]